MNTYAITYGNPVDGFYFVGPFDAQEDAVRYGESEPYDGNWWIVELQQPAPFSEGLT